MQAGAQPAGLLQNLGNGVFRDNAGICYRQTQNTVSGWEVTPCPILPGVAAAAAGGKQNMLRKRNMQRNTRKQAQRQRSTRKQAQRQRDSRKQAQRQRNSRKQAQ